MKRDFPTPGLPHSKVGTSAFNVIAMASFASFCSVNAILGHLRQNFFSATCQLFGGNFQLLAYQPTNLLFGGRAVQNLYE
jgi:hypothetical protein